jgi:hypothetical protein
MLSMANMGAKQPGNFGPGADWQLLASAKRIAAFQINCAKVSDRPLLRRSFVARDCGRDDALDRFG